MQFNHINHDKTRLTLFFGGFYTDYNCFEEFDTKSADILFINDYSKMDFDELKYFDFTPYTEINAIAYSYGVWALNMAHLNKALPEINKTTAISGTFCPVHPVFGINPKVFNIMLNALSIQTMANFERNMLSNSLSKAPFGGPSGAETFKSPERSLENLREELISIKKNAVECSLNDGIQIDTAILTVNDKIFPYKAQAAFWENHPHKISLNTGHFPFFELRTLDKILEM